MKGWYAAVCAALFLVLLAPAIATPCNPADPSRGVQICGDCYNCGIDDDVCPTDYGAVCPVCDPDCGSLVTWYRDADGDGYGNSGITQSAVCAPANYVSAAGDCNDGNPSINPGSAEICTNGIDDNCNGVVDDPSTCDSCDPGNCAAWVPGAVPQPPMCQVADPVSASMDYLRGTDYQPAGAVPRLDCDGAAGASSCWCPTCAPGYAPVGGVCVSTTSCEYLVTVTPPPTITFTATPQTGFAPDTVFLTIGSSNGVAPITYDFDTTRTLADGYERTVTGSSPQNWQANNVPGGSHTFYARVTDNCGRQATASQPVTIDANPAPVIDPITTMETALWRGNDVRFSIRVSDNTDSFSVVIDYGDGNVQTLTADSPTPVATFAPTHVYGQGTFTATVTATDAAGRVTTRSITVPANPLGLECTPGSHAGTPVGVEEQCCFPSIDPNYNNPTNAQSCTRQLAGVWNCFAVDGCFPAFAQGGEICTDNFVGPNTRAQWMDRDVDITHCEMSSASCALDTWADVQSVCIDDPGEYAADWVFPPGPSQTPPANNNNAVCFTDNYCYSSAGIAGCSAGVENTALLCGDGRDNDCDGLVDINDPDCQPVRVYGRVTIDTQGSESVGIGVNMSINGVTVRKVTGPDGNYSFTNMDVAGAALGAHTLYAYKFGYTTADSGLVFTPGSVHNIDLVLQPRRCNADCTNDQGFCDSSCIGVGECQPTEVEMPTLQACHPAGAAFGLRRGTEVVLDENEETQEILVGICCSVAPAWRDAPAVTVVDAGSANVNMQRIDTLVKYTRLVTLNGKTYRLVISTW